MKKQAVNTFDGGMVTDIDELHAKPNTLTYARNTEYITTEGNQLILQKRESRVPKINITSGYNIKAVEVIDDVAYIVSTRQPSIITDQQILTTFTGTDLVDHDLREFSGLKFGQVIDTTVFQDLKLTGCEWYIKRANGFNGNIDMKLYPIDGSGTILPSIATSSTVVAVGSVDTTYSYHKFDFSSEVDVSSYEKVAVVLEITGSSLSTLIHVNRSNSSTAYGEKMVSGGASLSYIDSPGAARLHLFGSYVATGETELGTFPSPIYPSDAVSVDTDVQLEEVYKPLKNFRTTSASTDESYNSWFRTTAFDITPDDLIHLETQKTYDGSINMIISSEDNPVRLINTKFKVNGDGTATLIKRRQDKNDNVYSAEEFQKSEIIPRYTTVGHISSVSMIENGNLPAGGYRYYFKYITADGVETDVIEESRTIDIHFGNSVTTATGGEPGEMVPKTVKISLAGLDKSFKGLKVYFSVSAGDTSASTTLYKLTNTFDISSSGTVTILHSGYEDAVSSASTDLNLNYSQIKNSTIIAKVNNRLALSGSSTSLNHKDEYAELATYALTKSDIDTSGVIAPTYITTGQSSSTHANPTSFYDKGEYWDGETYELGIVFITDKGTTPVYPIQGYDNLDSTASYETARLGDINNGFSSDGQNPYGVFRTPTADNFWRINLGDTGDTDNKMEFRTTHLYVDLSVFTPKLGEFPEIIGYYFVRKKRKKDILLRGLLVPTAAIPQNTTFGQDNSLNMGPWSIGARPGVDNILDGGYKWVPTPDCIMPYGVSRVNNTQRKDAMTDLQLRAPVQYTGPGWDKNYALYSPDIECNTPLYKSLLSDRKFGTYVYRLNFMRSYAHKDSSVGSDYNKQGLYTFNKWSGPSSVTPVVDTDDHRQSGQLTYVDENTVGAGSGSFAGSTNRNSWLTVRNDKFVVNHVTHEFITNISNDWWTINDFYSRSLGEDEGTRAGNALKFGRYVGVKFDWLTQLDLDEMYMDFKTSLSGSTAELNLNYDLTCVTDTTTTSALFDDNNVSGYLMSVYSSSSSSPISSSVWQSKYAVDDNSKYFAVSRRYEVNSGDKIYLGDGDCYSGLMWKRTVRPRGIDEAPQSTDTSAYNEDRRNLGMLDYGYAVSVPSKSNYNFHIRVPSNKDDSEYSLFGQKRSFLPVQGYKSIRGAKLDETDKFNHGYGAAYESVVSSFRLNPDSPYYKSEQPNRIYVSDADIESNFVNGFTQFKGLSYRDYNSELGPIRTMVSFNGKLVVVYDNGVATVGVDERSMVPGTEGDIYMDSAKALASKSEVKSAIFGSNQPKSVIVSNKHVYGVDVNQYKIWRTNGETFEAISDLKVQSWLKSTIDSMSSVLDSTTIFTVFSTYDARKSEMSFTFTSTQKLDGSLLNTRTIIYNELLQIWVCETDEHLASLFYIEENKYATRPDFESNIYMYGGQKFKNLLNSEPVSPTVIEFILNKDQNETKVLENMMIVGNSVIPDTFEYSTDLYRSRNENFTFNQSSLVRTPIKIKLADLEGIKAGVYQLTSDRNINLFTNPTTKLPLSTGDLVTIVGTTTVRTKILDISEDGLTVVYADVLPDLLDGTRYELHIGHQANLRLFNTEIHEGITYITCSGETGKIVSPRGKWVKVRMTLDGADPTYISGIASVYNQSLS